MQKHGTCELCGRSGLIADYGLKGEFICVKCANAPELAEHMEQEMLRRWGPAQVHQWTKDALRGKTIH